MAPSSVCLIWVLDRTGATLEDGWKAIKVLRKDGKGNGDAEIIFFSPAGKKLRSQRHVFDFLQLPHNQGVASQAPAASHSSHLTAAASEGASGAAPTSPEAAATPSAAAASPPAPAPAGERSCPHAEI